jgi:8-oxo-dGTP pyrophosphatase MutT (NUDIX family)
MPASPRPRAPSPVIVRRVRADVAVFDAQTPREIASRARFLAELDRLADPFSEHADPVHVTGSAIVVGPRGTVLHLHKRLHRWLQPGGHVEPGEAPWDTALRESIEETGLPLRHADNVHAINSDTPPLVHLDVHPAAKGHVHLDLRYLLTTPDADPSPPPGESPEVRWFSWDDALAVADDALVDALVRVRPR